MFDTTCSDKRCLGAGSDVFAIASRSTKREFGLTGVITWEEHCIECGQPYCFRTCKMYERAFDGKCKRFKGGITLVNGAYFCEFKRWGKLEGVFTGRLWPAWWHRCFVWVDRLLSQIVQAVNRAMGFVPGRIGAITIYRRLKKWALDYLPGGRDCHVDGVSMNVWTDRPVNLHFSIIDNDRNLFDDVVALKQGWNEWRSAFPSVGKGARFLLFPTEDTEPVLLFAQLDLVCGSGVPLQKKVEVPPKEHARFVKCVAWDLDNTLWNGILVEDGLENLILNDAAVLLIKELDRRGIVHTILSKNDFAPAMAALKHFGLEEYFVFPHINWLPKSGNLQAVAKEINIGLDTFAFIDDSPFERGEVSEKLPMVRVFNATEIAELAVRAEFNPPISAESASRRLSYRKEMLRKDAAKGFDGNYNEFLRSCKIVLTMFDLRTASDAEYQRCYELIQRTNQLTLAGRRYSENEFKSLVLRPDMKAFGIRCADKFGAYGIVGAVLYSVDGGLAKIEEFVMSCRVAKKRCEDATVNWIAADARIQGAVELSADVIETGRNLALVQAFDGIVDMLKQRNEHGIRYSLDLKKAAFGGQVVEVQFAKKVS